MPVRDLEQARSAYAARAWATAYDAFMAADTLGALSPAELERAAAAAYLIGRDADYLRLLERAHQAQAASGDKAGAARSAFWLGLRLLFRGEMAPASGWFGRAQRLLTSLERDCVEQGYLLLPEAQLHLVAGACEEAYESAAKAAAIGDRFSEPDVVAIAVHLQGRARIEQGKVAEGLALLDEAMVFVTTRELSPIVAGLIYCSVIEGCHAVQALDRAHQWTQALEQWCSEQPEMIAFTGVCRVHRAEIMQLHGAWSDALEEARRAHERSAGVSGQAAAAACYQLGELHRLRGEFAEAEAAYRLANECGREPQPGLALMRLSQAQPKAAGTAIRRALAGAATRFERMRLLPAHVEIALACGEVAEALRASRELSDLAERLQTRVALALAAHAAGDVELAQGNTHAAIPLLRSAFSCWRDLDMPYMAARARFKLAVCCRALGDHEGAELELTAARDAFKRLGAQPDLAAIEAMMRRPDRRPHGLTPRELEVLRLVARGKSNKAISASLFLSEKTVERHLSNIFAKLGVGSRAAATAYAYEHGLL